MHKFVLALVVPIDHNSKLAARICVYPCQIAIVYVFQELVNTKRVDSESCWVGGAVWRWRRCWRCYCIICMAMSARSSCGYCVGFVIVIWI